MATRRRFGATDYTPFSWAPEVHSAFPSVSKAAGAQARWNSVAPLVLVLPAPNAAYKEIIKLFSGTVGITSAVT